MTATARILRAASTTTVVLGLVSAVTFVGAAAPVNAPIGSGAMVPIRSRDIPNNALNSTFQRSRTQSPQLATTSGTPNGKSTGISAAAPAAKQDGIGDGFWTGSGIYLAILLGLAAIAEDFAERDVRAQRRPITSGSASRQPETFAG